MKKLILVLMILLQIIIWAPTEKSVTTAQAYDMPGECDDGFDWDCMWAIIEDWILSGPIGGGLMPPVG